MHTAYSIREGVIIIIKITTKVTTYSIIVIIALRTPGTIKLTRLRALSIKTRLSKDIILNRRLLALIN